jgi:hypothetical protein
MRAKTAMTLAVGAVMVAGITGFTFVENQLHPSLTTVSATTEEVRTVTLVDVEPTPSNFETVTVSGSAGTVIPDVVPVSGSGGVTLPDANVITVSGSAGVTL